MAGAARTSEAMQSRAGVLVLVAAFIGGLAVIPRLFANGVMSAAEGPLVGKPAPGFSLPVVANAAEGQSRVALADYKGSAIVLDFWATWCGPCRAEAPIVNAVANRFRDQGLTVVGINTGDQAGLGGPWAKAHHLSYPIAFDERNEVAAVYGAENLPTLVVISRAGDVIAVRVGMTDAAELETLVRKAL